MPFPRLVYDDPILGTIVRTYTSWVPVDWWQYMVPDPFIGPIEGAPEGFTLPAVDGGLPIVIGLHGEPESLSPSAELPDEFGVFDLINAKEDPAISPNYKFIAVFPHGLRRSAYGAGDGDWNAGHTGAQDRPEQDDVGFIHAVLDEVITKLVHDYLTIHGLELPVVDTDTVEYELGELKTRIVDHRRIYALGISNGANMCYRLAAELDGRGPPDYGLAAIACIGGTMGGRWPGLRGPLWLNNPLGGFPAASRTPYKVAVFHVFPALASPTELGDVGEAARETDKDHTDHFSVNSAHQATLEIYGYESPDLEDDLVRVDYHVHMGLALWADYNTHGALGGPPYTSPLDPLGIDLGTGESPSAMLTSIPQDYLTLGVHETTWDSGVLLWEDANFNSTADPGMPTWLDPDDGSTPALPVAQSLPVLKVAWKFLWLFTRRS